MPEAVGSGGSRWEAGGWGLCLENQIGHLLQHLTAHLAGTKEMSERQTGGEPPSPSRPKGRVSLRPPAVVSPGVSRSRADGRTCPRTRQW